ncbi:MAG: hypothetical protein ABSB42_02925 [Tepidisphaeraceae bacterium]|jgi:uncharacterized protein (DUF983 family)
MGWRLSCPRCGCRKILRGCLESSTMRFRWRCQGCGESCHDPDELNRASTGPDFAVGLGIVAMLTILVFYCLF